MSVCHYSRSRCALAVLVHLALLGSIAIAQQRYSPPSYSSPSSVAGRSPSAAGWFPDQPTQRQDAPSRVAPDGYLAPAGYLERFDPREQARPYSPNRQASEARSQFAPVGYDAALGRGARPYQDPREPPREPAYHQPQLVEPAVHQDFPHESAVTQVDWQEENGCGCACQCEGNACYSSYCSHCSDRWCLFPTSNWFKLGGWVDQGVTFNFNAPDDRSNTRVFFNDRSNDYLLNQMYLYAEAPVCNDGSHWDIGGRVDVNYGRDSRLVTVPGLERHRDRTRKWNGEDEFYGLALPQAYVEVAAPWLKGVSLKAGHFYSTMGYERFAAPDNFFYSHSYSYIFGEPFTFTGALATIKPTDRLTFNVGYTNGWDVWDSTSDEWGVLAGVRWGTRDGRTSIGLQVHSGADVTGVRVGNALVEEGRTAWTLLFKHCLTDRLRYVFQHDFGQQDDGRIVANIPTSTISFDTAKWYSINQYLIYEHTEKLSSGLRVEWFRDQDNSRASVPVVFNPGGPVFTGGNYVAVTAGLNWRPHSNVIVRPELRWDWSDLQGNANVPGGDSSVRAFVDGTRNSQGTAALDVILHY